MFQRYYIDPSNMLHMLNKELIRFKHSLSRVLQNQASERKALTATGCIILCPVFQSVL